MTEINAGKPSGQSEAKENTYFLSFLSIFMGTAFLPIKAIIQEAVESF